MARDQRKGTRTRSLAGTATGPPSPTVPSLPGGAGKRTMSRLGSPKGVLKVRTYRRTVTERKLL